MAKSTEGSGFDRHGIGHLSASSINLWSNAPDVWVLSYLLKKRTPGSAAMFRGICAEDLVADTLTGSSFEDALAKALAKFDKQFPIALSDKITKERNMIEPIGQITLEELKPFGEPDFPENGQHKVQIFAATEDWAIPVIGYLDFVFEKHGLVVDLKSTGRIPSTMSAEHQLQRCIYAKAMGNSAVKFLYVSPKKCNWLEDGDVGETLKLAKQKIIRLERFLRHVPDAETAASIIPHNPNSFYWNGAEDLAQTHFN